MNLFNILETHSICAETYSSVMYGINRTLYGVLQDRLPKHVSARLIVSLERQVYLLPLDLLDTAHSSVRDTSTQILYDYS